MSNSFPPSIFRKEFIESQITALNAPKALTLPTSASIKEALSLLATHKLGSVLLVGPDQNLKAIVTERDVLTKFALATNAISDPVTSIATPDPEFLKEHASIARALYLMSTGGYRHLPIRLRKDTDWHIISTKDFLDRIHRRLTSKIIDPSSTVHFDKNSIDQFFSAHLGIIAPSAPVTIDEKSPLRAALQLMVERRCGAVVVTRGTRVVGIYTERDFVTGLALHREHLSTVSVAEAMTAEPITLQSRASIAYALAQMSEKGFRHLPVMSDDERLIGVLSVKNFIDYLANSILKELA